MAQNRSFSGIKSFILSINPVCGGGAGFADGLSSAAPATAPSPSGGKATCWTRNRGQ